MAEPSEDAKKLSATILKRAAQTLQTNGINAVITAVKLPELIDLYLTRAHKKGRAEGEAEGWRKARDACARIAGEYAKEVLPVDPGGVARIIAGRCRALAEPPVDGSRAEPPYEPSDAEVNAAADAYLESNGKIGATVTFKDLRAALIAAHKARSGG